jgi:hypothetical protein
MKLLAIALSGREGLERRWGDLTSVQCKAMQNCYNESPLYNENILIKMGKL